MKVSKKELKMLIGSFVAGIMLMGILGFFNKWDTNKDGVLSWSTEAYPGYVNDIKSRDVDGDLYLDRNEFKSVKRFKSLGIPVTKDGKVKLIDIFHYLGRRAAANPLPDGTLIITRDELTPPKDVY